MGVQTLKVSHETISEGRDCSRGNDCLHTRRGLGTLSSSKRPSALLGALSKSKENRKGQASSFRYCPFASKWLPVLDEFRNFCITELSDGFDLSWAWDSHISHM